MHALPQIRNESVADSQHNLRKTEMSLNLFTWQSMEWMGYEFLTLSDINLEIFTWCEKTKTKKDKKIYKTFPRANICYMMKVKV